MINLFLFLGLSFAFVFGLGKILEKIRIPWVFAALLLGAVFSSFNPFASITAGSTFLALADLGMYFLLFMIGLELDLNQVREKKNFIFGATFFIITLEGLAGSVLIHFGFHYAWPIAFLVALSFATVGEAILIPILEEFKIVNTKLGQAIIGIGVADDIIEMLILILMAVFIGSHSPGHTFLILLSLFVLFALTIGFRRLASQGQQFKFKNVETLFFFVIMVFLVFVGIGWYADAAPIAALLAGVSIKSFIPTKRFGLIEKEVKALAYGFFVPIFFLSVGLSMDFKQIMLYPAAVLAVVLVSKGAKLLGAYIVGRKELGTKQSILLGIGLSVRFSTSIVIIKILLDSGLVGLDLYSIIVASSIAFKFIVPLLFSALIVRWGVGRRFEIKPKLS